MISAVQVVGVIPGQAILEVIGGMALGSVATDMPHPQANLDVPILAPFLQEELG